MKILVLNCGSSSIKYQLFGMPGAEVLAKGLVQRIGETDAKIEQHASGKDVVHTEAILDHGAGLRRAMQLLTEEPSVPLTEIGEIGAVGHRVVHGGEHFTETARIDAEVIEAIEAHVELAPLHNPPNLQGIHVAMELLPDVPQVAVFDTAFHQTMPPRAFMYAIPQELYRDKRIRRYGFHGTSHRYVAARAAEMLGKPLAEVNLISCHLGNGSSVAAIAGGRSIDTSMGLTPLEGLVMGTRCGDIDPAIIFRLERAGGLDTDAIDRLLNKQSGLLGLSGTSNDVRELLAAREAGDADAGLALEIFCYRLKKYIGAYLAVLGRLDALIFTAGIGENAPALRAEVCAGLEHIGLAVDGEKNASAIGEELDVTAAGMTARVLVVPTNEERMIALDTFALAGG